MLTDQVSARRLNQLPLAENSQGLEHFPHKACHHCLASPRVALKDHVHGPEAVVDWNAERFLFLSNCDLCTHASQELLDLSHTNDSIELGHDFIKLSYCLLRGQLGEICLGDRQELVLVLGPGVGETVGLLAQNGFQEITHCSPIALCRSGLGQVLLKQLADTLMLHGVLKLEVALANHDIEDLGHFLPVVVGELHDDREP
mmetsp:Transcript_4622/g.10801  ORF Transcript_4622/g.10801 Transcript_4622/m.10801 type:complete len:201 (+) Transcript_4622:1088-1690(+)